MPPRSYKSIEQFLESAESSDEEPDADRDPAQGPESLDIFENSIQKKKKEATGPYENMPRVFDLEPEGARDGGAAGAATNSPNISRHLQIEAAR